jgi:hypothetical protein
LPATGSPHHDASETPEPAQIGSEDKMGRIHEKDRPLSGFGLL